MLKELIKNLLIEFYEEIRAERWFGKERELVSRFAFSKLVKSVGKCDELQSTEQISIETRVKQVIEGGKNEVCKDMIIWREQNQTAWSENPVPLMIIEWKHGKKKPYPYDLEWLKTYTLQNSECIGLTVNIDNEENYRIHSTLIENGKLIDYEWILIDELQDTWKARN